MATYDIEKTYTSFWGGISDDSFLGSEYAVRDMVNIEVQENERYVQISSAYIKWNSKADVWWVMTNVKETPYSTIRWNSSATIIGGDITWTIWSPVYTVESYGTWSSQKNYFFLNNAGTIRLRRTDYLGTTLENTVNSAITAWNVVCGWHVTNLLFSVDNKIHYANTSSADAITSNAVTFTPWTIVKYIYSYSYDSTVVVTTNWNETHIYELEFTGWAYNITSKWIERSYKCIDAVGDKYNVYWVSAEWIHQYQWRQSQLVKYVALSSPKLWFKNWIVIWDVSDVYKYGSIKPWRNPALRKYTTLQTIIDVDLNTILAQDGSNSVTLSQSWYFLDSNTIRLLPFDGWRQDIMKSDLNFRFGYSFPKYSSAWYDDPRCEIEVKIMTDAMERVNTANFISVWSIATDSYGYYEISPWMVVTALETAWYSTEFNFVHIQIRLKAWDDFGTWYYWRTPTLFDFTVKANYVKS